MNDSEHQLHITRSHDFNMRGACVFSGSSHPSLVEAICERLGTKPAKVQLKKFANGETSVEISTLFAAYCSEPD